MLSSEDRAERDAEREALRAFLAGDQEEPFVLMRHNAYPVTRVLCTPALKRLKFIFSYFWLSLASVVPCSAAKVLFYRIAGVKIGREVYIAPQVVIDPLYPRLVVLEDRCVLGMGCRIFAHEYTASHFRIARVRIGTGSVVGAYATVRPGVSIGKKATVGFNSYVNRDVPDGETVGGVPARPLNSREEVD